MAKQLTQELIDLAQAEGIYDSICWETGISSLEHVTHVSQVLDPDNNPYVVVPQAIIDFLADPDNPDLFEPLGGYPKPIVKKVSRTKFAVGKPSIIFDITGSYLSPGNVVTSDIINIISADFVDAHKITVTASTDGIEADLTGEVLLNGEKAGDISTFESSWFDFRQGGDEITNYDLNAITQAQVVRDANGIGTTNSAGGWSKLIALPDFNVPRNHSDGVQLVYYKQTTGSCMMNMMASDHINDTTQYNNSHVGGYCQNQSTYWGFYSYNTFSGSASIIDYDRIKLVFQSTLTPGSPFRVYGLRPGDDWDNEDNLVQQGVTPGGTQAPGDLIYPSLTPNNGITARIQAFNPSFS